LSKKYSEKAKLVSPEKKYNFDDAVRLVKETAWAKFPESVDLAITLNLGSKKSESVRGLVSLPNGSGKKLKVAVLTKGEKIKEAEDAGADVVGAEDLVEKISKGFLDFDILIASPDMMSQVGKLGKVLGGRGLMPNPKSGTVTPEIAKTVKEFKGGKIEFKTDKQAGLHVGIGKLNFSESQILENASKVLEAIQQARPQSVKGIFIKSVSIYSSMSPGMRLAL